MGSYVVSAVDSSKLTLSGMTGTDPSTPSDCSVGRAESNGVTLESVEPSIAAGQKLRLADRSGTSAAAITAAAVASIDAGAANSVTLGTADASITAGQTLRLADAGGQSCGAAPK